MKQKYFIKTNWFNYRTIFYSVWLIISIIQAYKTELFNDEAYYWIYSKDLQFGYFDHPPIIALIIRIGTFLFGGIHKEIAVRLLIIPINLLTIYLIEKLIKPKDFILFSIIISSVAMLQVGGFLAIPDGPLLCFTALFFLVFKEYIKEQNSVNIIGLSLIIALLLYTKYHGILVIAFSFLANIKLLKRKSFYLVVILSLLFLSFHFYWLYQNEFITIKYHLFERSLARYSINDTLAYLYAQPFFLGGLSGILFFYYCFKYTPASALEKTLKWNFIGTLFFFLLMTYKGRVEVHWTAIAIIPMVVLSYNTVSNFTKKKYIKLIYALSFITVFCFIIIRVFLIYDFSNGIFNRGFEFHNQREWVDQVKQKSNGLPVVFMDSYSKAAKYEFYSGIPALSLNNVWYRRNQYNLEMEDDFQGKTVFLICCYRVSGLDSVHYDNEYCNYKIISNFRSYSDIRFSPVSPPKSLPKDSDVPIPVAISFRSKIKPDLNANPEYPSFISYQFFAKDHYCTNTQTLVRLTNDMLNTTYPLTIHTPPRKGKYWLVFSVSTGWFQPTINSDNYFLQIE
jgi:hypothetical protein